MDNLSGEKKGSQIITQKQDIQDSNESNYCSRDSYKKFSSITRVHSQEKTDARFTYDKILQIRDLDNQLMWIRVTAMLTVEGLLFAFLSNAYKDLFKDYFEFLTVVLLLGFVSSILFCYLIMGSDWWISWWQKKLHDLELKNIVIGEFDIFRTHPQFENKSGTEWTERIINGDYRGYLSTRTTITFIAASFAIAWITILVISFWKKFFV